MAVFDVNTGELIKEIASDLKAQGIKMPGWATFAKTGSHKERAPDNPEWFLDRMASILYRIYKDGPVGTEALRAYYGGKKRRGTKRPHKRKASGKIIRVCLQTLEKQGLIKKSKKGRLITGKGQSYLNRHAKKTKQATKAGTQEARPKKHEEKTADEKKVEEELKKQEMAEKQKEKAKEEEKKREKKKEEQKQKREES